MGDAAEADRLDRFVDRNARAAGKVAEEGFPEGKVLLDGQLPLHRVAVAEIVRGLAEPPDRLRCSKEFRGPRMGRQQACQDTQQRGLSGAVRPLDHKRFTAIDFEGNILENQVLAASGAQCFGDEPHVTSLSLYDLGRNAKKLSRFTAGQSGSFLRNYL